MSHPLAHAAALLPTTHGQPAKTALCDPSPPPASETPPIPAPETPPTPPSSREYPQARASLQRRRVRPRSCLGERRRIADGFAGSSPRQRVRLRARLVHSKACPCRVAPQTCQIGFQRHRNSTQREPCPAPGLRRMPCGLLYSPPWPL